MLQITGNKYFFFSTEKFFILTGFPVIVQSIYFRTDKSELRRGPSFDTKITCFLSGQTGVHSSCFSHFLNHFIFAYLKSREASGMEAGATLQL